MRVRAGTGDDGDPCLISDQSPESQDSLWVCDAPAPPPPAPNGDLLLRASVCFFS